MHKKISSLFLRVTALALVVALCGCGGTKEPEREPQTPQIEQPQAELLPAQTDTSPAAPTAESSAIPLASRPAFNIASQPYEPLQITPNVQAYTVAAGLSNVENRDQFPGLTQPQIAKLVENGFFVTPTDQEQLFYIYEDNDYKAIPTFVTTDSVLQAYHVYYNYALRTAEADAFYPELTALTAYMLERSIALYQQATEPTVKEQALRVAGYFGVAQRALGEPLPASFPAEILPTVEAELALVTDAASHAESPLLGCNIDYSLFTVRGHYTRSELLGRYFTAMAWYGVAPFRFYDDQKQRDTDSALRAAIMSMALYGASPAPSGASLWADIYCSTAFFVGNADDITPFQLFACVSKVYGEAFDINTLPGKLDAFYQEIETLPKAQIVSKNSLDVTGPQVRFMGQRYIPDSEMLQELCEVYLRPFPSGLDVLAVLGWNRAEEHIQTYENPSVLWPDYPAEFARMKAQFGSLSEPTWQSNLYYAWLYTLQSLKDGYGKGYPQFMQTPAWMDKSIATALASWAELRHDTILYGKSSGAEKGGGWDESIPAYVEPNAEVYNKLLWMTVYARENLHARGLLPEDITNKMTRFEELLTFLRDCSVKELRGEDLSEDECNRLRSYGGWLEHLTTSLANSEDGFGIGYWYEITSDTDRNMAVVADVHTVSQSYLEEAVGHAAEIYAVFPANGKLYLGRGAVFDYFEFESNKRLTDEEWQKLLVESPPERPAWTRSYME